MPSKTAFVGLLLVGVYLGSRVLVSAATTEIVVEPDGRVKIDGRTILKAVSIHAQGETVLIPWVDVEHPQTGTITGRLQLNFPVATPIEPRLIPSRCACTTHVQAIDQQTWQLTVTDLTTAGQVSVALDLPPNTIGLSAATRLAVGAEKASPFLLGMAFLLLIASLGFLGWLAYELFAMGKFKTPPTELTRPPNDLSPVFLSLIPSGKISQATLAALLVDLARRGYLSILRQNGQFIMSEARPIDLSGPGFAYGSLPGEVLPPEELAKAKAEGLSMAEKFFLSKLFTAQKQQVSERELKKRFGHRLSSWKIGKVYAEIYQSVTEAGLFIKNPHEVHLRYRGYGMAIFFTGLLGAIGSYFLPGEKTILVLVLAVVALAGYIITRMVPFLPLLTVAGQAEWVRWAGFRAYLQKPTPLDPATPSQHFFDCLPYALAFDALPAWTKRWGMRSVAAPAWFKIEPTDQPVAALSEELGQLVSYVAKTLAAIHEHTIT